MLSRLRASILPLASVGAVFSSLSIPSDSGRTGRCQPCLFRVRENQKLLPFIGVTHDPDGRVVQRLSVSTKVSIGLPPNGDRNHPTKLDHFVFLRKKKSANRLR